ncbi:MAG: hypothetical protein WCG29_09355 [Desulfomonile sp.]|jgi:hypothetical protein
MALRIRMCTLYVRSGSSGLCPGDSRLRAQTRSVRPGILLASGSGAGCKALALVLVRFTQGVLCRSWTPWENEIHLNRDLGSS